VALVVSLFLRSFLRRFPSHFLSFPSGACPPVAVTFLSVLPAPICPLCFFFFMRRSLDGPVFGGSELIFRFSPGQHPPDFSGAFCFQTRTELSSFCWWIFFYVYLQRAIRFGNFPSRLSVFPVCPLFFLLFSLLLVVPLFARFFRWRVILLLCFTEFPSVFFLPSPPLAPPPEYPAHALSSLK